MWTKCPVCGFGPVNESDTSCSVCGACLSDMSGGGLAAPAAERFGDQVASPEPLEESQADGE